MARSREYWFNEILGEKAKQTVLDGITSTSRVSVFGALAWVFSFVAWLLDGFFDAHKIEVDGKIKSDKTHRLNWYTSLAKSFQWGQAFNSVLEAYENVGLNADDIKAQKIVAQAATTEVEGRLRIKVAREVGGELAPLTVEQLAAFSGYIERTKDAGVEIAKDSLPPDSLQLNLDIFYDPLMLRADGSRIDGTSKTPIPDAIREYLRSLPFNGEYANSRLHDQLRLVDGVELVVVKSALAKYGLKAFAAIDERYIPDAGYLIAANADLLINYRAYV
jgi:hypothetical protein